MKHFIVIDAGTQNIKAFIFDEKGEEIHSEAYSVCPYFANQPDFAEQDAAEYLRITQQVTRSVVENSGVSRDDLAAVAITSHRSTIVPVDEEGRPVRPAITWLDERKTPGLKLPGGPLLYLAFRVSGMLPKLKEYQRRSKFNWLKQYEPESYDRTHIFLTISSHIFHSLTGEFKDCSSMIVGLFPIELKGLRWHPWKVVYKILGVERDKLPPLVSPAEIAGTVSEEGANSFGVPQGLPVIIGAGDKQSELLGAGVTTTDIAEISYGTAAVIEMLSPKFVEHPKMDFFTWGAAIPNHWALEGFIGRGYWMISWYKKEFCRHEEEEAERRCIPSEDLLNIEMAGVPPGSMGLVLQPYWHPRENDPLSKGAIIGFSGEHTRAHVYRAIVEGIAYELRRLGEIMEKRTGTRIKELRVGGGGSKSDEIMQITADIFGLRTYRLHTSNLSALGAAIDATVALNIYNSFPEAVANMVKIRDTFTPHEENVRIYDRLFNEVYKKMYSTLSPLHTRIAEITGYPKVG
ncbi:MAG: FGGY-family carbohydrate kinase [Dehalococcoidia bacterium]|nr:MAG: FGGY-family carbohydrate kinase [Dehalococcoidia bacterium]